MKRTMGKVILFFEGCTKAILSKPLFRILFCILICGLFYTAVFCIYPIQFETNDDSGQMYIYAGYFTGRPSAFIMMGISYFRGLIISGLYRLFPAFPCYLIFHVIIMFISSVIVSYCIIETANRYKTSFLLGVLFCILFLCVFTLRPVVLIQWTTVAGFPAVAAIALAITFVPLGKRQTVIRCALMAILILFSYIIRDEAFTPAVVVLCGILFYKSLKTKKIIFMSLAIMAFVFVGVITDKGITAHILKSQEWTEFYGIREQLVVNGEVVSVRNPEEKGLEPIEQYLVSSWCFLSEHMNADSLLSDSSMVEIKSSQKPIDIRLNTAIEALMPFFKDRHSRFLYIVLFALFVFAFILRSIVSSEQKNHDTLGIFCISNLILALSFILFHSFIAYICLVGDRQHFPARVQYMLMLLFAPYLIIASCALCGKFMKSSFYSKARFLIAFALIACIVIGIRLLSINELRVRKDFHEGMNTTMETIALHYPDYFFVYDGSLTTAVSSPFKVFTVRKPVNLMFWGGWNHFSPNWYEQLRCNGIDRLDYKSFLNDNVFLISLWDINISYQYNPFFAYMGNKFSDIEGFFNVVGEFPYNSGTIYVYKFFTKSESL